MITFSLVYLKDDGNADELGDYTAATADDAAHAAAKEHGVDAGRIAVAGKAAAPADAVSILRRVSRQVSNDDFVAYSGAVDSIVELIAAAGPVLTGDMTTVRGRLEMTRRLRVLGAALARAGRAK